MGGESGGGSKDDSGYDEEGGADDQDYPVLRLLGQLDGNTELDNALSMIADMHEERVDVVSRVCHEVCYSPFQSTIHCLLQSNPGRLSVCKSWQGKEILTTPEQTIERYCRFSGPG
jgi:hypothetical protein